MGGKGKGNGKLREGWKDERAVEVGNTCWRKPAAVLDDL